MINFVNVSKFILSDVSFNIPKGEVVGLIGATGSGKTTLVKLASGILAPESGRVSVLGKDPVKHKGKYFSGLGIYLTGVPVLNENDSAAAGIGVLREIYGIPKADFADRYKYFSELFGFKSYERERLKELSIGQRKRIELSATFIPEPELLLLDEPEIGLDEEAKQTLEEVIKEMSSRGCTILVTSHDLQSISRVSSRIMILSDGNLMFYGSESVLRHKFLPVNQMTLKYEGDFPMVDDLPLLKYSVASDRTEEADPLVQTGTFSCKYDERYVTASEILSVLMKNLKVTDISIKKPDLEQIILDKNRDDKIKKVTFEGRKNELYRSKQHQ